MPPETVGTVIAMVLVARSTARETVPEPYAVRPWSGFGAWVRGGPKRFHGGGREPVRRT